MLLFGGLPSRCMLIAKSVPPARHGGRAPVPPCLPLASASSWSASASKSRSRAGLVAGRGGHLQPARRRANSPTRRQQRAQPAPPTRMATQSKDLVGPVPIPGRPVRADAAYGRAIVSPPRRGISASRRASWLQGFASWTLTGTKFDVPSNYRLIRAIGTGVSRGRVVCAGCRTSRPCDRFLYAPRPSHAPALQAYGVVVCVLLQRGRGTRSWAPAARRRHCSRGSPPSRLQVRGGHQDGQEGRDQEGAQRLQ